MKLAYATNDKEALGLILCSGPQHKQYNHNYYSLLLYSFARVVDDLYV